MVDVPNIHLCPLHNIYNPQLIEKLMFYVEVYRHKNNNKKSGY